MNKTQKKIIGIIPARYASSRLPGKPLLDICGKPLLQRVWEAVTGSVLLSRVVIATDDDRISELCKSIGSECVMTPSSLPSGTDRVLYAYGFLGEDAGYVLNIQGDEPLLTGEVIDLLLSSFVHSGADVGTLVKAIDTYDDLFSPSVVKVVAGVKNEALYFSRNVIPHLRDYPVREWLEHYKFLKHIGIYAYKTEVLKKIANLPQSELEKAEKLEQLRFLENGYTIHCTETDTELIGVDTPEDLERVRDWFSVK